MEILVPAGNEEVANAAIDSGADAIYLGLTSFSARAGADNFDDEALKRVIRRAHIFGVKIHVAMNTVVKNSELNEFLASAVKAHNLGADALIIQDIFLGKYIHEKYPEITLHLSTQAGTNNLYGARMAKKYGFSRVILARETPFDEIKKIAEFMETEVFIQGALCSCFSGQCYLSGFVGGNSGNRGRCKQPCRKKYSYDRRGYEDKAYALSLADLSVGENIKKLAEAGVESFKIEGRMRRPEYVAAAIKYYRAVLSEKDSRKELSALKRTYNRNNYTQGLAFGQDKRFLSRMIQGHMGEKVGVVMMRNRRIYCESNFIARKGDCFKIIRKGIEVGGGVFEEKDSRGFYISSRARLANGDGVFVTTDTALNEKLLSGERKRELRVSLYFVVGKKAQIRSGDLLFESDDILCEAKSRPLSEEELKSCFSKSEFFDVSFDEIRIHGDIFIAKSVLNELRRNFFRAAEESLFRSVTEYEYAPCAIDKYCERSDKKAVISTGGGEADVFIFKPFDYSSAEEYSRISAVKGEKYLYIPPLFSESEEKTAEKFLPLFDGIYCDCYWGAEYAKEKGKKFFAGTGFHVSNCIDVQSVSEIADYYAVSKELSVSEQSELLKSNAFALTAGGIKVMDLVYCPFEKSCASCDKRKYYTLTDENSRAFPVRRYVSGACRFEVYNCADLISPHSSTGQLIDLTALEGKEEIISKSDDVAALKKLLGKYTFGHTDNSVL